jgi:hypothetical protein
LTWSVNRDNDVALERATCSQFTISKRQEKCHHDYCQAVFVWYRCSVLFCSSDLYAQPFGLGSAKELIESNQDVIERFAHPTVDHISCECDGIREISSGFIVRYIFRWKNDDGEKHSNTFDFHFNSDAKIVAIEPQGQSNIIPPFAFSSILIAGLGGIFDEILKDTRYTRSDLQQLMDKGKSKELLTMFLRVKQG